MKTFVTLGMILVLAGCGGVNRFEGRTSRGPAPLYAPTANGPIKSACLASDRKARSGRLCGCIQAVADQTLSRGDQRRAVGFYDDPHSAQEIRQSDRARDETFWKAYSNYGSEAARVCT